MTGPSGTGALFQVGYVELVIKIHVGFWYVNLLPTDFSTFVERYLSLTLRFPVYSCLILPPLNPITGKTMAARKIAEYIHGRPIQETPLMWDSDGPDSWNDHGRHMKPFWVLLTRSYWQQGGSSSSQWILPAVVWCFLMFLLVIHQKGRQQAGLHKGVSMCIRSWTRPVFAQEPVSTLACTDCPEPARVTRG